MYQPVVVAAITHHSPWQPLNYGCPAATHRPRNDMGTVERIALVLVDVDQGGPNRVLQNPQRTQGPLSRWDVSSKGRTSTPNVDPYSPLTKTKPPKAQILLVRPTWMNLERMGKVEVDCNKEDSVANKPSQSPESACFFFGSILHVKSAY